MNNSPCNPNSNLQNVQYKARSNLLLPKSKVASMNRNNLCNAYKRCGKNSSSLPPMSFAKTTKHVYLIDSNSPITAREYGIIFGNGKLTQIKKIATKLGFMVTKLNTKEELKGKIIEMLKKLGLTEPIQLPVTVSKKVGGTPNKPIGTPFGTPTNNNNKNKPFGTPFGTPSNINNNNKPFGTPSNNNKPFGTPFGTPTNNNNNNKNKPAGGIFGTPSNNNKPNLFGGIKPRQTNVPGVNNSGSKGIFGGIKPRQNAVPGANNSGKGIFGAAKPTNGSNFTPSGKKPKVNSSKLMQQISKEISNLKNKI